MKWLLVSVLLIVLAPVLWLTGVTVARYTQPDFGRATRTGVAVVGACDERGPVTLDGFGRAARCKFDVTWKDGTRQTVSVDHPGFADAGELGHDITIGQIQPGVYARPDRPSRPLITVAAWALYVLAGASLIIGLIGLRRAYRARVFELE